MSLTFHYANAMLHNKRNRVLPPSHHHLYHRNVATPTTPTSASVSSVNEFIPPRRISRDQVKGILRRPREVSIEKKETVTMIVQNLWKLALVIAIPLVGYIASFLFPSLILCPFFFVAFVLVVKDYMDCDPSSLWILENFTTMGQDQSFRHRLVNFAEGTKFHRLPKPMSRKQKKVQSSSQQFIPILPVETRNPSSDTFNEYFPTISFVADRIPINDEATNSGPSWEDTNRRLRSLIHKHHDDTIGHDDGYGENEELVWSRLDHSKGIHPKTTSSSSLPVTIPSFSKLNEWTSGTAATIRPNMEKRPLSDLNNRS